ncbi:MAG: EAL domain-containing protein [Nitrosomonas sp.]|nr:EAL domain-containing protein [Nitrosomonas sp.]
MSLKTVKNLNIPDLSHNGLINNLKQIVFQLDSNGNFIFLNDTWKTITGLPIAKTINRPWLSFIYEHDRPKVEILLHQISCNKEKVNEHFKCRLYIENKRLINVEVFLTPLIDIKDTKGFIGTFYDITEHKKTELQLEIQKIALESVDKSIVITDPNAVIEWVSPAYLQLTGFNLEETLGKTFKDLVYSGRQDNTFYVELWQTISANKVWEGDLVNKKKNGALYDEHMTITPITDTSGQIKHYIAIKEDISQRKASKKEIEELAFYDPLTKLPNRRLFLEQLKHVVLTNHREQSYGALLFVNIDNFKTLNDTHGHSNGDLYLTEIASQISNSIRSTDTVARLGGDEFVVMLEQLGHNSQKAISEASNIGEKILALLNQEYCFNHIKYRGSSSIGICMFMDQYNNAEDILKRADTAMYEAKNAGRNTLRFFDPVMQNTLEQRIQLEKELGIAQEKQEFKLYYQLIINNEQKIVGAEALLRWQHPKQGVLEPNEFLSLIENNGMIIPIGDWIIKEGLEQLHRWQQSETLKAMTLSINISAIQFQKENFVSKLKTLINDLNINCNNLFLELTESSLIYDIENTTNKIDELKSMGIRFSIDDFGTGFSSLSYLKSFKLAQLKIDRLFVRDILTDQDDLTLVKTIIDMGRNLGLDIVAEGVENKQQLQILQTAGCIKYQGYWINKPMSEDKIHALIKSKETPIH